MTPVDARPRRYTEFEAYRGLASVLIVVFHAYQYTREGGRLNTYLYEGQSGHLLLVSLDTAVAWFFALSGFLMYMPYALSLFRERGTLPPRVFLYRRAVRILPLYFLVLLLVWAWRYSGQPGTWTDLLEHLTFTHVWDSRYIFYTVGPAWSLGAEIIYYVMLAIMGPLLVRFAAGRPRADQWRWLVGFPVALVLISVVYKYVSSFVLEISALRFAWYFNPLAHVDSFAFGMLLAVVAACATIGAGRGVRLTLAGLGAALMAFTFLYRAELPWVQLYTYTLGGAAFTLFLASTVLARTATTLTRRLEHRFWTHLGLTSYGMYLWHEPLMLELSRRGWLIHPDPQAFWTNVLALVLLSGLLATITYWMIELPAQEARDVITPEGALLDDYAREQEVFRRHQEQQRVVKQREPVE